MSAWGRTARRSGWAASRDLDLDVAVTWDEEVLVLDEEEFIAHSVELGYPSELQDQARKACGEVLSRVAGGVPPFDGRHVAVAAGWGV